MRRIPIFLLVLALASAAPAWAGSGEGNDPPAAAKTKAPTATAPENKARSAAPAMSDRAAMVSELTRMQQMIQEQAQELAAERKQIEALRLRIDAVRPAAAAATASSAVPAKGASLAAAEPSASVSTESASNTTPPAAPVATAAVREPAAKSASLDQGAKLPSDIELAGGRIQLGFTVYGDWAWYPNSSYGPQFETQINQPGPGNNNFNSFDINRAYINFFYTPTSGKYTLRLTPNIYRDLGTISAVPFGSNAQIGSTSNGSLTLRMKYAYVQFNHPFASSSAFSKDMITLGQTTNPLIDWQEAFYGYRFTSLVPWNYLSLSSTHMGAKIGGPIMVNGKRIIDYEAGVFDSGSFHNQEVAAEKQVMARLSVYPMGGTGRFGGFGLTAFVDYGYANKAPDQQNTSQNLYRTAFFAHYWAPHFAILGEYDYGKNAFSAGNFFSGSAPIPSDPTYGFLASEASGILTSSAQQRGFDFYGHVDIPHSPFALFGLYQYFQPNTNVSNDPLDFDRIVGGIGYKFDSHLMFAVDSQNVLFTHSQGTYNNVANAVPPNINALFINMQVNY
ncbi:MAG TPA: hypothetical protein VNJ12_07635 [Candidatus Dormibacteraeota bacterium]|nr:hypothetical protein [Candidatus Dormibacteraeota bacterium]